MMRMGKRMKRAPDTWTAKNAEKARNETDPIIKSGEVQVYTRQGLSQPEIINWDRSQT
jgi:hypothetical protein